MEEGCVVQARVAWGVTMEGMRPVAPRLQIRKQKLRLRLRRPTPTATTLTIIQPIIGQSVLGSLYYTARQLLTSIYRTYWYYYWTSFAPYTMKTVTSTETTTTTIWSAYATASAEASESFEYYITARLTPPYSATSLKSSTNSVPISTGSSDTDTATATATTTTTFLRAGGDDTGSSGNGGVNSAPGASSVSGFMTLIGAIAACLIGGLAFGL